MLRPHEALIDEVVEEVAELA